MSLNVKSLQNALFEQAAEDICNNCVNWFICDEGDYKKCPIHWQDRIDKVCKELAELISGYAQNASEKQEGFYDEEAMYDYRYGSVGY